MNSKVPELQIDAPLIDRRAIFALDRFLTERRLKCCFLASEGGCDSLARSHSVQNAVILDYLVDDSNHVFVIEKRIKDQSELAQFRRIGRNSASTFTALCAKHDKELFGKIDLSDSIHFDPNNKSQCITFSMRAVLHELWNKTCVATNLEELITFAVGGGPAPREFRDLDPELFSNIRSNSDFLSWHLGGARDAQKQLERRFRSMLSDIRQGHLDGYVLTNFAFDGAASIGASSAMTPPHDFLGRAVNTFDSPSDAYLTVQIFPYKKKTYTLFCHHSVDRERLDPVLKQLRGSLARRRQFMLSAMILENCENVVFSPRWLNRRTEMDRKLVLALFAMTLHPLAHLSQNHGQGINLFK